MNDASFSVGNTIYIGGVANRMIVDGVVATSTGDIHVNIQGPGVLYSSPMMSDISTANEDGP